MHRLIMNPQKTMVVDHINGNSLDNRMKNLRIVTKAQNNRNLNIKKTSKYPGVWWCNTRKKYIANIHFKGINYYLGSNLNEDYLGALAQSIYNLIDTGVIK